MVATRSELAVRRWSIVSDELIEQLRLLPFGAGETAGGVIIGTTPVGKRRNRDQKCHYQNYPPHQSLTTG